MNPFPPFINMQGSFQWFSCQVLSWNLIHKFNNIYVIFSQLMLPCSVFILNVVQRWRFLPHISRGKCNTRSMIDSMTQAPTDVQQKYWRSILFFAATGTGTGEIRQAAFMASCSWVITLPCSRWDDVCCITFAPVTNANVKANLNPKSDNPYPPWINKPNDILPYSLSEVLLEQLSPKHMSDHWSV